MFFRSTYKDKVKKYVIDLILNHKVTPGDQIKEKELAEILKISRAPVREALRELIAEKILEYKPYKGTYLKKTTPQEAMDIYTTRGLLEGYAVVNSMESNLKNIRKLSNLVNKMYDAALKHKNKKLIEWGDQFHNLLILGCENNLLLNETKRFGFICHILFFNFWPKIYSPDQIKSRHENILHIIKKRNKLELEYIIREHYFETGKKISNLIEAG
ncbi:GntR family transcriptional regulator [Desulfothermus okinawensis JCM 13304]